MDDTKEVYNNEPVHYCSNCLSLRIKGLPVSQDLDYCEDCGGTDIRQTHISIWEKLHIQRYGFRLLNKHL